MTMPIAEACSLVHCHPVAEGKQVTAAETSTATELDAHKSKKRAVWGKCVAGTVHLPQGSKSTNKERLAKAIIIHYVETSSPYHIGIWTLRARGLLTNP